jgi:hypothetical protein
MNKKNVKELSSGRIEIVSKREPKKITQQKDPFARINLHPLEDVQEPTISNNDTNPPSITPSSTPPSTSTDQSLEIAPTKNFHRVANSINREALEKGLFDRPSYKVVYDVLYLLTRGNIVPSRKTRISKEQLQKKSGLGSRVTLDGAIVHLQAVGLLRVNIIGGKQGGNEYEVLLPEETNLFSTSPSTPSSTSSSAPSRETSTPSRDSTLSSPGQNLEALESLKTTPSSTPVGSINIESRDIAKTFLKTKEEKRIDDEPAAAFQAFFEKINEVFKQLMGRQAKQSDSEALAAIGELLAAEILEAAGRTKVVSDAAKFSLTHLRRRLGVRTINVETSPGKEAGKGTASSKPLRQEIQLSDDEIQECPDCQGRLLIYPAGQGKGAVMCRHQPLIKAKQSEQSEQKKGEGK